MDTVGDVDAVVSSGQAVGKGLIGSFQDPVELLEVGEGRLPHPNDQVFVDEAIVVGIAWIQFIHGLLPVRRLCRACGVQYVVSFLKSTVCAVRSETQKHSDNFRLQKANKKIALAPRR